MTLSSSKRRFDGEATAVRAASLSEALCLTRLRYGQDVRVLCSREITGALVPGARPRRLVEVVVVPPDGARRRTADRPPAGPDFAAVADRSEERGQDSGTAAASEADTDRCGLAETVERIEEAVERLARQRRGSPAETARPVANRFGQLLLEAGTTGSLVTRLVERFVAETSGAADDESGLRDYLQRSLATGSGEWSQYDGAHAFVGPAGGGKSEIAYAVAAQRQAAGSRTLLVSVAPHHPGEIRRLQRAAAQHGYDGAVVTDAKRLAAATARRGDYDTVLVDLPPFAAASLTEGGDLHDAIVQNASLQRHFVIPIDIDLQDAAPLWHAARDWQCDWWIPTRLDRTVRPGKLLDFCAAAQLPVSFLGEGPWPGGRVRPATSQELCAVILAAGDPDDFCGGGVNVAGAVA